MNTINNTKENTLYTAAIFFFFYGLFTEFLRMKYARYISIPTAAPLSLGSFTQGAPHVKFAQTIPVVIPNSPKNKPVKAVYLANKSQTKVPLLKYLMEDTKDTSNNRVMANHMGT